MPRTAIVLTILLSAGVARADHRHADSAPLTLDARAPLVEILAPEGAERVHGFDLMELSWTVAETHPGPAEADRRASLAGGGAALDSLFFSDDDGLHTWDWTVVDTSTGDARLSVSVRDAFGNLTEAVSAPFTILLHDTAVEGGAPPTTRLDPPRPNPFNPATDLSFGLEKPGSVRLTVHDLRGRNVRTLVDRHLGSGTWTVRWDGRNDAGRDVPAGPYLCRLRHDGRDVETRKVVLLP